MPKQHAQIEPLVRSHYAGVWRYLRVLGADHAEADDITQETFLSVMRSPIEERGVHATGAYLRRIARNLLIDLRRRDKKLRQIKEVQQAAEVFEEFAPDGGDAWMEALEQCLEALPERTQGALEMSYGLKLTTGEVAERLGMKENGAKTLLQRARAALRDCIEGKLGL